MLALALVLASLAEPACSGSKDGDGAGAGASAGGGSGASGAAASGTATAGAPAAGAGGSAGDADAGTGGAAGDPSTPDAGGEAGVVDCDPKLLRCRVAEQPCPEGQVHEMIDGCYGACVPIDSCRCDAPDDCPHEESFVCHMFRMRCGPYL